MAPQTRPPDAKGHVAEVFRKMREQSGYFVIDQRGFRHLEPHEIPESVVDTTAAQEFMYEYMADGEWHLCHKKHKKDMVKLRTQQVQDLRIALNEVLDTTREQKTSNIASDALSELGD